MDKADQAKSGSLLPWGFLGEGGTSVWEAGKSKWEAKQDSGICEESAGPGLGVLVWPSRDIAVLFPLPEQVSPGTWLPTPAQNKVTPRSLFVWSASRPDGHQQPIGNVALSMRSKIAKISPTNGG